MIYSTTNRSANNGQCDICADRGPCHYCKRPDMYPTSVKIEDKDSGSSTPNSSQIKGSQGKDEGTTDQDARGDHPR